MKISLILTTLLCLTVSAQAQQESIFIKEKKVSKVIGKLASDEMRGRSALSPKDINKAASYIEKQFKKVGLSPLEGLSGYRQEFTKQKISRLSLEVTINGNPVPEENLILSSAHESISLDNSTFIDTIGKSQPLFPTLMKIEKENVDKIIWVSPEHEQNFRIAYNYLNKPKILDPGAAPTSTKVYILGNKVDGNIIVKAQQEAQLITMANVVGMLKGKLSPDEYVIFSSHYDHIGIQDPVEGDSIANGADDDASGTTAVISLARYFKKLKSNARSLIFVAFTAEEIGGFGSKYFSTQLNSDQVIAMFNIEMIGKQSKWGQNAAFITGFERSDLGEILQENMEGTPFQFHPDPYPEQNLFYRSDNATLARLGVPAHTISTDQIPTDSLYHTVQDEVSSLDMANITSVIRAIAKGSKSIVNGTDKPTRIDKSTVQ